MLGIGLLLLAFTRPFWAIVFFVAGLASVFTTLASIIHFQILGALFFFFVTLLCWALMVRILDGP